MFETAQIAREKKWLFVFFSSYNLT